MELCEACGKAQNPQRAHERWPLYSIVGGAAGVSGAASTGAWFLVPIGLFVGMLGDWGDEGKSQCASCGGPLQAERAYRVMLREETEGEAPFYVVPGKDRAEAYAFDEAQGKMIQAERPTPPGLTGAIRGAVGGVIGVVGKATEIVGKTAETLGKTVSKTGEKIGKVKRS